MSNLSKPHATWKHTAFALAIVLAGVAGPAAAQDLTVGWNPRSGDVWVDTWLGDVNRYGTRYREPFIDEIVRYHGAPRSLVVELLDRRWAPGDIYYACALASIIGRPCRYVADLYEADRGQGWGVIAQRLGIKPGSAEFHRLKKGFVPTYDRWARPIELDEELRRAYPDRGKGNVGGGRTAPPGNADKPRGNSGPGKSAPGNPGAKKDHNRARQDDGDNSQGSNNQGRNNPGKSSKGKGGDNG